MAPDPAGRQGPPPGAELAVLVLAAGEGSRLRPLSWVLPKPLCPVVDRTLLDHSLDRVGRLDPRGSLEVVVNVHHGGAALADHLDGVGEVAGWVDDDGRVRSGGVADVVALLPSPPLAGGRSGGAPDSAPVDGFGPGGAGPDGPALPRGTLSRRTSVADGPLLLSPEVGGALGTAGAVGRLVPWLDGRGVLVLNGDTFTTLDLDPLLEGWDGESHRVLVAGPEPFGPGSNVAGALVPWRAASGLAAEPSGLWEACWRDALAAGDLDWVNGSGLFFDCGTPRRYLEANLAALEQVAEVGAGGGTDESEATDPVSDPGDVLEGSVGSGSGGPDEPDGPRVSASGGAASWLGPGSDVTGAATRSVVGAGAEVHGEVVDSVVWPGAVVHPGESLRSAIRTGRASNGQALSVLVR